MTDKHWYNGYIIYEHELGNLEEKIRAIEKAYCLQPTDIFETVRGRKATDARIHQPCFGREYDSDGSFCTTCQDKKECWCTQETGSVPEVVK